MIKGTIILLVILNLLELGSPSVQCHYSCSICVKEFYSSCTACSKSTQVLRVEGYGQNQAGVCSDLALSNGNILGIFLFLFIFTTCIVFPKEQMIYFAILIQSLGLLYLVEVLWSTQTHYIFSAMTYLMLFTKIQYAYNVSNGTIDEFKSQTMFKTTSIIKNLSLVGCVNIILVLFMIVIPIFKLIRRKIYKERFNCLPDFLLDKILMGTNFLYLMMIQETQLNIFVGFKSREVSVGGILAAVAYYISLLFFIFNQRLYPFPFFRSKIAQFIIITMKIITPIFILTAENTHYLLFILLLSLLIMDVVLTNKNRNSGTINRLLYYKLYSIGVILLIGIYYVVQLIVNSENISKIAGIVSTLLLCGVIYLYLMEICIEYKNNYCVKEKPVANLSANVEITKENFKVGKITIQECNFTNLPVDVPENIDNNSDIFILQHKPHSENHLSMYSTFLDNGKQRNPSKPAEKNLTVGRNSEKQMGNEQNMENFEELKVRPKLSQQSELPISDAIPIKSQTENKYPQKRKGKKRKQKQ